MKPKKSAATKVQSGELTLQGGDALTLRCRSCSTEFEIQHEPRARRPDDAAPGELFYCPYCGEQAIEAAS